MLGRLRGVAPMLNQRQSHLLLGHCILTCDEILNTNTTKNGASGMLALIEQFIISMDSIK